MRAGRRWGRGIPFSRPTALLWLAFYGLPPPFPKRSLHITFPKSPIQGFPVPLPSLCVCLRGGLCAREWVNRGFQMEQRRLLVAHC